MSGKKPQKTAIKMLLPREVLHTLATSCPPWVFSSIMLGHLDSSARTSFLEHLRGLAPWSSHPVLSDANLSHIVPLCIHADGAQFYRDDEHFVYSMSSLLGNNSCVKDVLLTKIPLAIIPERFMVDHDVPSMNLVPFFVLILNKLIQSCFLNPPVNNPRISPSGSSSGERSRREGDGLELVHFGKRCCTSGWVLRRGV